MRKRKERMSEGKKNIIAALLQEYDIQDALKDLLGGTIESMLEAEFDDHLGYAPYKHTDVENSRNGKKQKKIHSKYGEVKDILILCADGLTGIKESINVAFPNTEYQRCIIHQVRNTLKYVADKDKRSFSADLKTIYHAPSEEVGHTRMLEVTEKWQPHYSNAMKSWSTN